MPGCAYSICVSPYTTHTCADVQGRKKNLEILCELYEKDEHNVNDLKGRRALGIVLNYKLKKKMKGRKKGNC